MRRLLIAASLFAAPAMAEPAPAIVECKWDDGSPAIYEISAGAWLEWSPASWTWQPIACSDPGSLRDTPPCRIEVSASTYSRSQEGQKNYTVGPIVWAKYANTITIDRQSGRGAIEIGWLIMRDSGRTENTGYHRHAAAMCTPAADPMLKPKPRPVL